MKTLGTRAAVRHYKLGSDCSLGGNKKAVVSLQLRKAVDNQTSYSANTWLHGCCCSFARPQCVHSRTWKQFWKKDEIEICKIKIADVFLTLCQGTQTFSRQTSVDGILQMFTKVLLQKITFSEGNNLFS
jgi:hypothetical protein